jgi:hypothetical protein
MHDYLAYSGAYLSAPIILQNGVGQYDPPVANPVLRQQSASLRAQ